MADLTYIVAGYSVTFVAVLGYRWSLVRRTRHARQVIDSVSARQRRQRTS